MSRPACRQCRSRSWWAEADGGWTCLLCGNERRPAGEPVRCSANVCLTAHAGPCPVLVALGREEVREAQRRRGRELSQRAAARRRQR